MFRPEEFYTCDLPQLSNGSDDEQIGICQKVPNFSTVFP